MSEFESRKVNSGGALGDDLLEASPSAGWRATYFAMGVSP